MSRRTLLLTLVMAAIMVVFGAGTSASAGGGGGGGGPNPVPWPGGPVCAQGTLAFATMDAANVWLAGSIQPCVGADPAAVAGGRWTVARYFSAGDIANEGQIRPFDSATAPTPVSARFLINNFENAYWGSLQAACLITGVGTRLACVEFTTEWNGVIHVDPIPVDDPRVTVWVTIEPEQGGDPECIACP